MTNARTKPGTSAATLACALVACVALLGCESRVAQGGGGRSASARVVVEGDGGRWVDVEGGKLRVERYGSGSRALIVPLSTWLAPDLAPLADARGAVFYGLRGRSRSPAPDDEAELDTELDLALDVRDLETLRVAEGLERMSIVGISYGAALAVHYALEHPERVDKLVLVAPLPPRREPYWKAAQQELERRTDAGLVAELERLRAAGIPEQDPEAWCRAWLSLQLRTSVHEADSLARVVSRPCGALDPRPEQAAAAMQTVLDALGDWDWRAELARVRAPTLVVVGAEDVVPVEAAREWVAALPDARLLELPAVARMPWIEDPISFFVTVESFLGDGLDEAAVLRLMERLDR